MAGPYADRSWYDLCEHVYIRGAGWDCKTILESTPFPADHFLKALLIIGFAVWFIDWCAWRGREDGELHG